MVLYNVGEDALLPFYADVGESVTLYVQAVIRRADGTVADTVDADEIDTNVYAAIWTIPNEGWAQYYVALNPYEDINHTIPSSTYAPQKMEIDLVGNIQQAILSDGIQFAGSAVDQILVNTSLLDVAVSSRAAPGAAMTLTSGERTTVQGLVLSDATPIQGARIDAAVSSRAAPGAAMTLTSGERTAIQSTILSDATPFPGARIDEAVSAEKTLTAGERTAVGEAVRDTTLAGAAAGSVGAMLTLLGAISAFSNVRIDNILYNAQGFMTSARIRVFANAADATAGQNEIETVNITGTPHGGFPTLPSLVIGTNT